MLTLPLGINQWIYRSSLQQMIYYTKFNDVSDNEYTAYGAALDDIIVVHTHQHLLPQIPLSIPASSHDHRVPWESAVHPENQRTLILFRDFRRTQNMKRILSFGIVLVLLLACVGAVSANLVTNGGFETSNPPFFGASHSF